MVVLASGDFGAAEAAGNHNLDALGVELDGSADGLLHRAAERDTLFQLRGNAFGDELRVEVGLLNLDHVDAGRLADEGFDLLAELFDFGAALADDDAGLRTMEDDADFRVVSLNFNLGNARLLELFLQELSELIVRNRACRRTLRP